MPMHVHTDGEHDEVDDVAARPDRPEAQQLQPVPGVAHAMAHADAKGQLNGCGQLVGHHSEGIGGFAHIR